MLYVLKSGIVDCAGFDIPVTIVDVVSNIVLLIKIAVPILLIIYGMLDLGKAVMAQKEDEIKKGQQTFIKRLIAAAIVFFVIFIVQLVMGIVAGDDADIWNCVNMFVNGR
ncbi:MAG: hypothetical protein PHE54_04185 [Bacilli bacterium]|nr:hypothetical protein [Bacilli bacterium]